MVATGGTGDGSTEPADPCANVDCGDHGECQGGKCVCTDNYTGDNCETAPAGESCGETMCSVSQHCENDTCVCNEGTFTCDPDTSSVNACCAEGYYCGTTASSSDTYECLAEQACPEACSDPTSWTTGTVSVQYCAVSEGDCYHVKSTSCDSITVTCGVDDEVSKMYPPTNRKYCYSTDSVSWWNGKSICKALGMRLPSMNELIGDWDGTSEEQDPTQFAHNMARIMGSYFVWSSNLSNSCDAWFVRPFNGQIRVSSRSTSFALLCVQ